MTCHDHLRALRDHAAGAGLTPRLEAHLGTCASCVAALDAERSLLEEIDVALSGASQAEPSRAFLARVKALADRPEPRRILLPSLRIAAALLAVGLSTVVLQRFEWRQDPTPLPPTLGMPEPLPPETAPPIVDAVAPPPRSVPTPRLVPAAAAVVPPGQEALVQRLAALIESGVVELPPPALENDPDLPLQEPTELFVPPLTIPPIEAAEAPSEE
jgi:hypothetical protein